MTDLELHRYYSEADIFVLPSLFEAEGIVLKEAQSYGLPIICSNRVASLDDKSNVSYVDALDSNQIRTAILNDEGKREEKRLGDDAMLISKILQVYQIAISEY